LGHLAPRRRRAAIPGSPGAAPPPRRRRAATARGVQLRWSRHPFETTELRQMARTRAAAKLDEPGSPSPLAQAPVNASAMDAPGEGAAPGRRRAAATR